MALSQSQILALAERLNAELVGQRMSKIIQYDADVFSFSLSKSGRICFVLNSGDPRVYLSPSPLEVHSLSSPFSALLRKEVSNALIRRVFAVHQDRVLGFELLGVDTLYREITLYLIAELIPTKANLILLDGSKIVLGALRTSSLNEPRPLFRGLAYEPPLKKEGLIEADGNPFDFEAYQSNCIQKEAALAEKRKRTRFHALYRYAATREKSLKRKIKSIESDLEKASSHFEDGQYGDYIYMHYEEIHSEMGFMEIEGKKIPLDPSRNVSSNAEMFYRRAKKAKATSLQAAHFAEEAKKEAKEWELFVQNLDSCDEASLEKLAKEYGLEEGFSPKRGKTAKTPLKGSALRPYFVEEKGVRYVFGKNASQNDFLSFLLLTRPTYLWFHVKEGHGAHLILQKENPTKEEISLACEMALLASGLKEGEVLYTEHKNVRRGNAKGQAIVKTYQSATFRHISERAKALFGTAKKWGE